MYVVNSSLFPASVNVSAEKSSEWSPVCLGDYLSSVFVTNAKEKSKNRSLHSELVKE